MEVLYPQVKVTFRNFESSIYLNIVTLFLFQIKKCNQMTNYVL